MVHLPARHPAIITVDSIPSEIAQAVDSVTTDTLFNMVAHEQMETDTAMTDTTKAIRKVDVPHYDIADLFPDKPATDSRSQQTWSVDLAYVGGLGEQNYNRPYGFTETPKLATTGEPPSPVTFENWSDYAAFLAEMPDEGSTSATILLYHSRVKKSTKDNIFFYFNNILKYPLPFRYTSSSHREPQTARRRLHIP